MPKSLEITSGHLRLSDIYECIENPCHLEISSEVIQEVEANRSFLESVIKEDQKPVYGVNTGFGSLCDHRISEDQVEQLQYNLIVSHACGQGDLVPYEICKLIVLLKIKNLAFAKSGVRPELIERLVFLYNNDIIPVIYQLGSLGASGDLAPLAHMSLILLGKGEVWRDGERLDASDVLTQFGIEPLRLAAKEGLALINGTQFSLAYALWSCYHAEREMRWSNVIASLSLEAFRCSKDPFDEELNALRNQKGQIQVAREIRELCEGSEILEAKYNTVQDPYSFRCVPQVHGASFDAIEYVKNIVEREINAVTDNPNVLDTSGRILSGGNFHAQPLALVMDHLAIALSELASISERRTFKLVSGLRDLPDYLTKEPGLNSGLMIPQYTAASIVSQNKQLASPASVDSISSSKGQEDHVSMAANAGTRNYRIVNNVYSVLAIELMVATQALEFNKLSSSASLNRVRQDLRSSLPALESDRVLNTDINICKAFIRDNSY